MTGLRARRTWTSSSFSTPPAASRSPSGTPTSRSSPSASSRSPSPLRPSFTCWQREGVVQNLASTDASVRFSIFQFANVSSNKFLLKFAGNPSDPAALLSKVKGNLEYQKEGARVSHQLTMPRGCGQVFEGGRTWRTRCKSPSRTPSTSTAAGQVRQCHSALAREVNGAGADAARVVIVVTDGEPNRPGTRTPSTTVPAAIAAIRKEMQEKRDVSGIPFRLLCSGMLMGGRRWAGPGPPTTSSPSAWARCPPSPSSRPSSATWPPSPPASTPTSSRTSVQFPPPVAHPFSHLRALPESLADYFTRSFAERSCDFSIRLNPAPFIEHSSLPSRQPPPHGPTWMGFLLRFNVFEGGVTRLDNFFPPSSVRNGKYVAYKFGTRLPR